MSIEAIIVSFNCLDLLSITLPRNLQHLDHIIILTKKDDTNTIKFCQDLDKDKITIICADDEFNYDGAIFNKGLAINRGIAASKFKDWIITLDSDIILPASFRDDFCILPPDNELFYGMRRYNIDTREDFNDLEQGKKNINDFILYRGSGYGYFSMFNYKSKIFQDLLKKYNGFGYPFWIKEAREIDWIFRNSWGERKFNPPLFDKFPDVHFVKNSDYDTGMYRELPFNCLHLGIPGKNHEIRKTEKF